MVTYHLIFTPDDNPRDTHLVATGDPDDMRTAWLEFPGDRLHENHHMDACAIPPGHRLHTDGVRYSLHLSCRRAQGRQRGSLHVRVADHTYTVTCVLGETRQVAAFPDGSYNCPFCSYAVAAHEIRQALPGTRVCDNPVCDASRRATIEHALARKAGREEAQRREAEWRRREQAMSDHLAETRRRERDERQRRLAEARQHGYCQVCILGYHGRKVRHRQPENCPRPREVIVAPTRTT
jgi:hypothetical protein